jgi:hypothetical protein
MNLNLQEEHLHFTEKQMYRGEVKLTLKKLFKPVNLFILGTYDYFITKRLISFAKVIVHDTFYYLTYSII